MRLIDADALWGLTDSCNYISYEDIMNQPTIEPQKMRGKWNEHPKYTGIAYLCSQCNWFTTMRTHFCPNCGADMRETE